MPSTSTPDTADACASGGGKSEDLPSRRRVAVDPFCVSKSNAEKWQAALAKVGGELVRGEHFDYGSTVTICLD